MATCYHCGCSIRPNEGYRRKVQTGTSTRIYISRRPGGSYGQSYGLRTLCQECATTIDKQLAISDEKSTLCGIAGLVGLISAVISLFNAHYFIDNDVSRLIFAFFLLGGPGFCLFFLLLLLKNSTSDSENPSSSLSPAVIDETPSPTEPFPGIAEATGRLYSKLAEQGISLMGCYGYENSQNNAIELIEHLCKIRPPRYFANLSEWETAMYDETLERFSKDAFMYFQQVVDTLSHGNEDAALEAYKMLFKLFPLRQSEELEDYGNRLVSAFNNISDEAT